MGLSEVTGPQSPHGIERLEAEKPLKPENINPYQLIARIGTFLGVTPSEILSKRRTSYIAWARIAMAYTLRRYYTHLSFTDIGIILNRDHTTIIAAVKAAEQSTGLKRKQLDVIIGWFDVPASPQEPVTEAAE
jgi:chromosomal replication initiation ATPase DnaA